MPARHLLCAIAVFACASPVLAEETRPAGPPPYAQDNGDRVTVGFGLGMSP